jgi:hypothetical protein
VVDDHGLYTGLSTSPLVLCARGRRAVRSAAGGSDHPRQGSHIRSRVGRLASLKPVRRRGGIYLSGRAAWLPRSAARCSRAGSYRSDISWSSSSRPAERTSATSRTAVTAGSVSPVGEQARAGRCATGRVLDLWPECALREHPALGRWLRQTPAGRLVLDKAKIAAETRLDGKYLLSTSDPDLSAEDIALGYKNLLEAERGFRDLKSTIELRPVFHRLEPRIRAHVRLCWLVLLLIRVAERRTSIAPSLISERCRVRAEPGRRRHLPISQVPAGPGRPISGLRSQAWGAARNEAGHGSSTGHRPS